jgi:hypothetical protein
MGTEGSFPAEGRWKGRTEMARKEGFSGPLNIRGRSDVPPSPELVGFYSGEGTPVRFLRERCGFGKSRSVQPRERKGNEKMIG